MTKKEVLALCKEASKYGYLTHELLLEIWKDNEEIPNEYVKLIIHKPEPVKPIQVYFGLTGYKKFKDMMKEVASEYVLKHQGVTISAKNIKLSDIDTP